MDTDVLTRPGTAAPEDQQLLQTIEMFEVITQSQPNDIQSLEILKEAYGKLARQAEFVETSRKIAEAYVAMGQLSSAILEYESILQRFPDDPEVIKALNEIEGRAISVSAAPPAFETDFVTRGESGGPTSTSPAAVADYEDGRASMHKLFVGSKELSESDFDLCWVRPSLAENPAQVIEPFIQVLADRALVTLEKSLKLLTDNTGLCHIPLDKYDFDIELARSFPRELCQRWCVLPFDRLSKSILIATTNPFNKQAALDFEAACKTRLLWYLASPIELSKGLRKVFR
jgi:tetratricopeptide (TPR) repeat protein